VRYRSQNDPLINDESATDFVLTEVDAPNAQKSNKVKTTSDLEAELDVSNIRKNEGEAAMYGIYFDDTKYDYMQHMREMGVSSQAVFIEAPQAASKQRGKKKTLDEALKEEKLAAVEIPKELLPSETLVKKSYQDMQDVPDALAGFQPDMDPRLREVLEALEDEAYVDDDEDIFAQLAEGGEADPDDFFDQDFEEEEDDGWASDATEKAPVPRPSAAAKEEDGEGGNEDWMKEFSKFKKAQKKEKKADGDGASSLADTMSFGGSSAMTAGTISVSGRRRRRREKKAGGARTSTSGYSMSSSALFRTEGLTLLDDRFDKVIFPACVFMAWGMANSWLADRRGIQSRLRRRGRAQRRLARDPPGFRRNHG
jgi:protein LTV1